MCDGQREEIYVGQLTVSQEMSRVQNPGVEKTDVVG